MLNIILFAAGLALQAPAPASGDIAVLSACDSGSNVVARVPRNTDLQVIYSIADAPTCYLVTYKSNGKTMRGFVFDRRLNAVMAFEHSRVDNEVETFSKPIPIVEPAAPKADAPAAAAAPAPAKTEVASAKSTKPQQATMSSKVSFR